MLDERCDQVAEERSTVGRVSAQVPVFGETSGHGGSLRRCLLLCVVGVLVAEDAVEVGVWYGVY